MLRNVLLLCATRSEWSELRKAIPFSRVSLPLPSGRVSPSLSFYQAQQKSLISLCQIGIGPRRALAHVLDSLDDKPDLVIHFGLSGALRADLQIGTLVLADSVTNDRYEIIDVLPSLVVKAQTLINEIGNGCITGRLLTNHQVIATPDQKREAGQSKSAVAVDMETFPTIQICQEKKVSFLSVRSIFDPLDWDLGQLDQAGLVNGEGNLKKSQLISKVLTSPRLLMSLPKYQSASAKGNKALTRFILKVLENW